MGIVTRSLHDAALAVFGDCLVVMNGRCVLGVRRGLRLRRAPDGLHAAPEALSRCAGASHDGTTQDEPCDRGAAEDEHNRDDTFDHALIMREVVSVVKYFVKQSKS